jgi:glycosyltransferase involved in cell wall biosynthesis
MKIAIVYASFYALGGAENTILWLASELLNRGHQVTIFTSEYARNLSAISDTIRQCMVEVYSGGNYSTWLDWMLAGLRLRKRLQRFDVVNPHNFPAHVWVYFAKLFSRSFPKVIWYCQELSRVLYEPAQHTQTGHYPSLKHHLAKRVRQDGWQVCGKLFQKSVFYGLNLFLRRPLRSVHTQFDQRAAHACDLVLANSEYSANKIRARYHRAVTTCYLGVPIQDMPPMTSSVKKDYFLTVTRLEPLKRVDALIQALYMLVSERQIPDARLLVIGTGSQEEALSELIAALHLEQHVQLRGYVDNPFELHRYYQEALAFVFTPEDEPFGLVPLEAMLQKTAVIVSREGGILETVVDRVTGFLVDPKQIAQIADAMAMLWNDRQLARDMGEQGYRHVMEHFTCTAFVDRFEQALHAVLGS